MRAWIAGAAALLGILSAALPVRAATSADLSVRLTAVSFRNGTTGLYTISITNAGPQATDEPITASIDLPAGFSMISGGGALFGCDADGSQVTCVRTAPMDSSTATFQLRVNVCSTVARVSTRATIRYAGDARLANNSTTKGTSVRVGPCVATATPTRTSTPTATPSLAATNTPGEAGPTVTATPTATATATTAPTAVATDLSITKTVLGAFRVGSNGNYSLTVFNNGPSATNVPFTVSDPLPNGLTFRTVTGTGWSCAAINQNVTCIFNGTLAAGSSTSLVLTVGVGTAAAPTVTNSATVEYGADLDPSNNTARRPTTVRT
ncbi:MAG TPA: DUF11 domain-containing protein [Terriglobales bacterium]|nr:DUF11 domain-containing protein [Terriglobales bacterium]